MELTLDMAEVLGDHRGERHVAILHEYPDPDAIASAFAHRLLSAAFDIDVDILYAGEISHRQNVALVRLVGIELRPYDESDDMSVYQAAVFLDHQGTTVPQIVEALDEAGVPVLLLVDHHEDQGRLEPTYSEIQKVGSTATIYTGYLQQGVVELDTSKKDHIMVATALMHGVMTDTSDFVRARPEDFQAASYLSRFRDAELLEQIMSQARSKHAMDIIHRALGNRVAVESFSIAGIGYVRAEDRDAIPQAADFLLSEENIHTAIVYGIIKTDDAEETVIGSMRTAKLTLDPDSFIKDVFGRNLNGHYFGGGKPSAGGFLIPVGFLSGGKGEQFQELKWQIYDAQVKHKIFTKIGVDASALAQP